MILVLLGISGLFSGLLSFFAAHSGEFMVSPGIIFGICLSIYFFPRVKTKKLLRLALFTACSGIAYHLAFRTFGYTEGFTEGLTHEGSLIVTLLLAGGLGATVLAISLSFLLERMQVMQIFLLIFLGSFLSLTWFVFPEGSLFETSGGMWSMHWEPFFSLYLFWQMGMALGVGIVTKISKKIT